MAQPQEYVDKLEKALLNNVGVKSINVDGQQITFADRKAIIDELKYWQVKASEASTGKKRRMFISANLRNSF